MNNAESKYIKNIIQMDDTKLNNIYDNERK